MQRGASGGKVLPKNQSLGWAEGFLGYGTQFLVTIMPFHAFLAVYLGTVLGHRAAIQSWKEVLIVTMTLAALAISYQQPERLKKIARDPLTLLIVAYAVLSLIISAATSQLGNVTFLFGVKTNLIFLALFLIVQLISGAKIEDRLTKIIIITTTIVAGFGVLQALFLPPGFLAQFGYGTDTIEPFRLVDPAVGGIRILSTLGGPNQLGSFLILPISLCLQRLISKRAWLLLIPLLLSLTSLFYTYSRSAWIGCVLAILVVAFLNLPKRAILPLTLASIVAVTGLGFYGLSAVKQRSQLQFYILHGQVQFDEVRGSDGGRLQSLRSGLNQAIDRPLGRGLGTAGPASLRSDNTLITENYYLQLAIEVGLAGLVLFLGISAFLAHRLFGLKDSSALAIPLLAALVGISIINLFLHGWTDSSTALIFWAVAGVAVSRKYYTNVKPEAV